jgi:WG containing repeat
MKFRPIIFLLGFSILLLESCSETKKADSSILFPFYGEMGMFSSGFNMGYMDLNGDVVISAQFDDAMQFTEGLGCVGVQTPDGFRYGYIDSSGVSVIDAKYYNARPFQNGRAWVANENHAWGVIDRTGKAITPMTYSNVSSNFMNGYCYAYVDKGKSGPSRFEETTTRIITLGIVGGANHYFYNVYKMNLDGDTTRIALWTEDKSFRDSIVSAQMNFLGKFWHKNSSGGSDFGYVKFNVDDYEQSIFSECGNYNDKGTVAIKAQYKEANCFFNGYARVKLQTGESAYIDTTGTVLFTFEDAM